MSLEWKLLAAGFSSLAILGFKKNLWLVAATLAGHAVFDFLHDLVIEDPGVPHWWAGFAGRLI